MARQKDPQRLELIFGTALKQFAERGFHAVSVKELADAAGISLGSLYTYFTSKEELVNELYRRWKRAFVKTASDGIYELSGRTAHRKLWENVGRFIECNPEAFHFLESQMHQSYLDETSKKLEEDLTKEAVQFYINSLQLGLDSCAAQLLFSASFGIYVQVHKAAKVGLLKFDLATQRNIEALIWHMALKAGHIPTEKKQVKDESLRAAIAVQDFQH